MLRDPNLHAFSHQHQHALALCVRIDRALRNSTDVAHWNREIAHAFATEIDCHFHAEEQFLFPAAAQVPEIAPLIPTLLEDHVALRGFRDAAGEQALNAERLREFAETLSVHVRKEERELFEHCQQYLSSEQLSAIHAATHAYFARNGVNPNACPLP